MTKKCRHRGRISWILIQLGHDVYYQSSPAGEWVSSDALASPVVILLPEVSCALILLEDVIHYIRAQRLIQPERCLLERSGGCTIVMESSNGEIVNINPQRSSEKWKKHELIIVSCIYGYKMACFGGWPGPLVLTSSTGYRLEHLVDCRRSPLLTMIAARSQSTTKLCPQWFEASEEGVENQDSQS